MATETQKSKKLLNYAEAKVSTGDPEIDALLEMIASTCQEMEKMGGEMDRARDEMDRALAAKPRDAQKVETAKAKVERLMERVTAIETQTLPKLLRQFQEIGHEKGMSAALSQQLDKHLRVVSRSSELAVGKVPTGESENQSSPWDVE